MYNEVISMECHGTHMTRFGIVAIVALVLLSATALPVQAQEDIEEESNVIIDVVLPVSLAFIMFSLGIGLTLEDFSLIFREPKAFGIGMANQMVVLPLMGFAVATLAGLEGEMAVGLIILACCPGGVTSNIITKLARGDTALSISYTAVVSVVTVISLPIIVGLSMDHFMGGSSADFEVLGLGLQMFVLTALPVAIGMGFRSYRSDWADTIEGGVSRAAAVLFVIIVLAAIASEWDTLMDNIGTLGPAVIGLNVIMLTIGYQSAKMLDLEAVRATTVAIESGIQNASVGITVGGLIMAPAAGETLSTLSLPSGVYGVLMYIVTLPFVWWISQRSIISSSQGEE
ncbi:MAG: bile acid:sodium symporter [Euryarchaeota archaeon]|nr:bile acid:sodium symporter [Euryarchaeota archaeon]